MPITAAERERRRRFYKSERRKEARAGLWSWGKLVSGVITGLVTWLLGEPANRWESVGLPFAGLFAGAVGWYFLGSVSRFVWKVPEDAHLAKLDAIDALDKDLSVLRDRLKRHRPKWWQRCWHVRTLRFASPTGWRR